MNQEMKFKNIVAQYSNVAPEEITNNMRFREDLGFSSLDFMSFLGELEPDCRSGGEGTDSCLCRRSACTGFNHRCAERDHT